MPENRPARKKTKPAAALLLGIGLDAADGEKRITTGRDFLLLGGSADTHAQMTERAIKLDEELARRGRRLADVRSAEELRDVVERAWR
jgi:hypothetical protein